MGASPLLIEMIDKSKGFGGRVPMLNALEC